MAMQTPDDLFLHELSDMYDAEQTITNMLPKLAEEAGNSEVRSAFEMHLRETRQQIQNLDQCFQLLGWQRHKVSCDAVQGLKKEHASFIKEKPEATILTLFDLGAAAKTEHYEIASYEGLITRAGLMGQQEVARLLEANLAQEQEMARKVSQLSLQLGQQYSGPQTWNQQPQVQTQI
ncbi:MAG TPA: ferritin-like domain-containing protein [Ktedonobacterales bacterium]|jgi:ferritin-like metal-binding protein YciE